MRSKNNLSFEEKFLELFGILGTMPMFNIGGLTAFTILLFGVILYKICFYHRISIKRNCIEYTLIVFLCMVSAFGCMISSMPAHWKNYQVKGLIFQVLYLLFFVFYNNKTETDKVSKYIYGVYIGAIIQLIWGYLQLFAFYVFHLDINNLVFCQILNIVDTASQFDMYGTLKVSGLCWNSGNYAPVILFGYCMSRNLLLKMFFGIMCCCCGSRTLLLGFIAVLLCEMCLKLTKIAKGKKIKKKNIVLIIPCIVILGFVLSNGIVADKVASLITSLTTVTMMTEASALTHALYWTTVPEITQQNSLFQNLFGFGMNGSGWTRVLYYNQYANYQEAWTIECDYIDILWSRGYLGFIVLYFWILKKFYKGMKMNLKYGLFFVGFLIEGVTYNVMMNWCWILILSIILLEDNKNYLPDMSYIDVKDKRKQEEVYYDIRNYT